MAKDLQALSQAIVDFSDARGWEHFHTPRNVLLALVGEVGELAAELQWLGEMDRSDLSEEHHQRVAAEIADVQIYLIQFARTLDINITKAVEDKMAVNATRWPLPTP